MPIDKDVLGFSNRWYPAVLETAQTLTVAGSNIRVITPVYFLASKLEAFHGRGADDVALSHDLEDIISVVDGRAEIVAEIAEAEPTVRKYIASEIGALLENEDFVEALSGFLLLTPRIKHDDRCWKNGSERSYGMTLCERFTPYSDAGCSDHSRCGTPRT